MKPKLNILSKEVRCESVIFEDIPNLKAGTAGINIEVFDATEFCKASDLEEPPYYSFYTHCYRTIKAKVDNDSIKDADLFYQNTDGHILIHVSLAMIYMQHVDPNISLYFDSIAAQCLINGIAFSDSFAVNMAMERIPDETLQQIITARHEQEAK